MVDCSPTLQLETQSRTVLHVLEMRHCQAFSDGFFFVTDSFITGREERARTSLPTVPSM